jgi:hypothetical protein
MKSMKFLVLAALLALASVGEAKELASRLGVGYRNALVTMSLPSIATIYYPSSDIGVIGSLGVDTDENNSKFGFSGGVRRIIFKEEHMNFFMGGNVALVNQEQTLLGVTSKESGFEMSAVVGGEFFLQGLDSLGFNFETGMGITNVRKVRFRTLGDSFLNAGMIFYF